MTITREEYIALADKEVTVNAQDLHRLKAQVYVLSAYGPILKRMCPKCYNSYLAEGYICPCCGYDSSYPIE